MSLRVAKLPFNSSKEIRNTDPILDLRWQPEYIFMGLGFQVSV
jgi:hypothetical protein